VKLRGNAGLSAVAEHGEAGITVQPGCRPSQQEDAIGLEPRVGLDATAGLPGDADMDLGRHTPSGKQDLCGERLAQAGAHRRKTLGNRVHRPDDIPNVTRIDKRQPCDDTAATLGGSPDKAKR